MSNVEGAAGNFYDKICKRIDAIYDPAKCKTRKDLVKLIDDEVIELMKLQQFTNDGLRDACYEDLRNDKIKHPEILWARHVGTKVKVPYYSSIREELPLEQATNAKPPVDEHKGVKQGTMGETGRTKASPFQVGITVAAGAGLTVVGVGQVIAAGIARAAISPISIGLMALGICITATGVVKLVTPKREKTQQVQQSEEEKLVEDILRNQRTRCKEYAKEWCKGVLNIVQDAVEQDRAGE